MFRLGFVLICVGIISCKNNKSTAADENGFSYEVFSKKFPKPALPFVVSDTSLQRNTDTTLIRSKTLSGFITDSLKSRLFGKNGKVKYVALAKFSKPKAETYFVVKGINGSRRAAILLVFNKDDQFAKAFTLLNTGDLHINQVSTIDRAYSVTLARTKKKTNQPAVSAKEVYQYNPTLNKFSLIMTDASGVGSLDIINPIDSFPRKNKLSGDYIMNKTSFISIRDGRHANQLLTFIHFENESGCSGELKGEILLTSPNTAIYRQGGDPCILSFRFSPGIITLKEDAGCGSHRGIDCLFEGSFHRKKELKQKKKRKRVEHL